MNSKFVFPAQQMVTPRQQRPQKLVDGAAQSSRDSNTLRASVLDAALELGIGSNSLVADWMFNNAVREEDELEEPLTPEHSPPLSFPDSQSLKSQINGNTNIISNGTRLSPGPASDFIIDADVRSTASNNGRGIPVAFPDGVPLPPNIPAVLVITPAPSVYSTATKKLKKPRKGDGYESDSGYVSEGGRKSKEKEMKKKAKAEKSDAKVGKDAGLIVDPDQRTRKRSFVDAVRGRKAKDIDAGYATDGSSSKAQKSKKDKSKAKFLKSKNADDVHYETDGDTKKSKTKSFFKLSSKSSKPDLKDRATTPPVPLLKEQMPLPIAQRFATTLASPSNGSTFSLDETRSTTSHGTSVPQTSVDGFGSTTSLGVSLPSAESSKSNMNVVPPLNLGNLPALSFQPLNVNVDAQPPSPQSAPPHLSSAPVSFLSSAQSSGTIRDSQASSGSSSSGTSNPRSRTTTSEASTTTSNISSSFTSPSTSHSHFQISSPRLGHGGTGSTSTSVSQHGHGYGHGQTQRMDNFGRPSAGSRPTSPPSSAAAAAAAAGMMSFQITRDVTTVPLMMRQIRQEQQGSELLVQIQDDVHTPTQISPVVETEHVEAYPKRMSVVVPTTAPLQVSKGGGLRIKPSLEKINLLGLRKDNREQLSAGGATPSPISPAPLKLSHSPNSQYGLPISPMHPSHLQSGRPKNGTPTLPPQSSSPGNLTLSPHSFISAPNSATPSPVLHPNSIVPSRSPSRPRLSLNPPPNGNQLVAPNVLAYYDIPPPSPPPMGPLPLPPQLPGDGPRNNSPIPPRNRSRSPIPPYPTTNHNHPVDGPSAQFPSPAQLRQRMLDRTPRKLPSEDAPFLGAGTNLNMRRGKESPFPPAPIFQRPFVPDGVSSSGASDESAESGDGVGYHVEPPPRSPIVPVPLNNQEKRVLDSVLSRKQEKRSSWIDFGEALSIRDNGTSEEDVGSRNDEHDVGGSLDSHGSLSDASEMRNVHRRLDSGANRSEESAYSDRVLTRSRSSEILKPANPDVSQIKYAWDDSLTVGDRTSRWSGSVYSRMSIMDEEESNAARDRFVKRVEAMLADGGTNSVVDETERNVVGVGGVVRQNSRRGVGRDQYVPPVPKIPIAFAGSTMRSETVPAGRMWNKF